MTGELFLRRTWTLRALDRQAVFVKKPYESDIRSTSSASPATPPIASRTTTAPFVSATPT